MIIRNDKNKHTDKAPFANDTIPLITSTIRKKRSVVKQTTVAVAAAGVTAEEAMA
jgi:hypothetical protein